MREIALDTETTGLDPEDGHRIVEIGCVEMIDGVSTGEHFHVYINPERDMPEEAFKVHGLSNEFLRDKPVFSAVAESFLTFIRDSRLVIHNASFDMKFLNAELVNARFKPLPMSRSLDTVAKAKRMFPGSPVSLDALCKRFGIDLGKRTLHGALLDSELLAEVYLELTGGRQNNLWSEGQQDNAAKSPDAVQDGEMQYQPALDYRELYRSFVEIAPTDDERQAHDAMVEAMKSSIWKNIAG